MTFNFDHIVSRFGTNSAKWDGMAQSLGSDMIALSVADMDAGAASRCGQGMRDGPPRYLRIHRSVPDLL